MCTCAVRNCLECRYRQQCGSMATSVPPPVGDQLTPIQALIAGVQTPPRPVEAAAEQGGVISVHIFIKSHACNKGNQRGQQRYDLQCMMRCCNELLLLFS